MTHWIYIIECEDDYLYIGETTRLFKRFNEHLKGRGGSNTIKHKPIKLVGLYKVNENDSFIKYRSSIKSGEYNKFIIDNWANEISYDNLLVENHFTERMLYERRENTCYGGGLEWYKIRGGKYTKNELDEVVSMYKLASEKDGRTCYSKNPIEIMSVDSIVDRPLCKCEYPSEVKLSRYKSQIYFVCALKNVWDNFFEDLEIAKACDFWQLYTEDSSMKDTYNNVLNRSKEEWIINIPLSLYKINPESCISCGKTKYLPIYNKGVRRLCQQCILTKYDELKKQYEDVCLISIK